MLLHFSIVYRIVTQLLELLLLCELVFNWLLFHSQFFFGGVEVTIFHVSSSVYRLLLRFVNVSNEVGNDIDSLEFVVRVYFMMFYDVFFIVVEL